MLPTPKQVLELANIYAKPLGGFKLAQPSLENLMCRVRATSLRAAH